MTTSPTGSPASRSRTRRRRPTVQRADQPDAEQPDLAHPRRVGASVRPGVDSDGRPGGVPARPGGADAVRPTRLQPLDVLLATSMLQVGVDVQRLGLMVVTGQPKNMAEYIQATSRVGRDPRRPGLVLTIYQWTRPRDLAHFEHFGYDHATFGLRVEGLTTTPFSDRALDRGLSGRAGDRAAPRRDRRLPNTAAHVVPLTGPGVHALLDDVRRRAEVVTHDSKQADGCRDAAAEPARRLARTQRRPLQTGRLGYEQAAT